MSSGTISWKAFLTCERARRGFWASIANSLLDRLPQCIQPAFLHIVHVVVIVSDRLRRLVFAQLLQLLVCKLNTMLNAVVDAFAEAFADMVFDLEVGNGLVHKVNDAVNGVLKMSVGNGWPLGRLAVEELGEKDLVEVSWQLSATALLVCLGDMLANLSSPAFRHRSVPTDLAQALHSSMVT